MLCYRCGSHVPDTADKCPTCGQNLAAGGLRQATGTFSRRRPSTGQIEGAPYRAQDLVANRYLIKDIIGAGPLGFVFRAHDKEIDVEVALKVINPKLVQSADERKNFAKVLRAARKLSHPNLVRVYEEGEDQDRPYFTSQFLDGLTLRKIIDLRLQKGGFFALHEIEPILVQVCAALDGAHKVGPHSDLKPDNVLVLPDLLKVTDFGLGLAMPRLPFVQAMKARKSDRYLSPELVDGSEIDLRADVYSVGVILGEMLSGLTPDGSIPELARRNPDVPQAVEGIYRKAINSNPVARFKTAAEFIGEFSEQVKKVAPQANPVNPKVESATGTAPPPRTRTTTGMLQLQPRRETKLPPVVDIPPPPPISGEQFIPDATQPVDPEMLALALRASAKGAVSDLKQDRQETEVIDSGMFIASLDDEDVAQTNAYVESVPPPPPANLAVGAGGGAALPPVNMGGGAPSPFFAHEMRSGSGGGSKTYLLVIALVFLGVAVGGGGGYYYLQRQKAEAQAQIDAQKEQERLAAQRAIEKVAADKAAEEKAIEDRLNAEKLAADQAAAEKANAKTPAEKAAAERAAKLAADKAAAEKAAADKAEAEKVAAAEKADKAAAEKAAREKAAAEKNSAAEKTAAAEKAAEKAAADKAAREKAAADKAEKAAALAAEKAAADKAAKEKAAAAAAAAKANAEPTCTEGMRPIAGGAFKMGTAPGDSMMSFDEKALSSVDVPAFCIDVFEYPNKKGATVMSGVGFADAKRMCETAGKRLCTEAEWEKACKGPNGAKWPYGAAFDANACNTENDDGDPRTLAFSGRFAKCRSAYGVADLSGNVSEWTAEKIIKGGSYASSDYAVRCSARKSGGSKNSEVGFRCCSDSH